MYLYLFSHTRVPKQAINTTQLVVVAYCFHNRSIFEIFIDIWSKKITAQSLNKEYGMRSFKFSKKAFIGNIEEIYKHGSSQDLLPVNDRKEFEFAESCLKENYIGEGI